MIVRLYSAALHGVNALEVEVEVNAHNSDKFAIQIVGLPDAAVRESSQRVLSAIGNSALQYPGGLITVNLAPADIRKEGPSFDLPIALALVAAEMGDDYMRPEDYCIVGELALDGTLRPVKGILSIAIEARRAGRRRLIVPVANAAEASVVEGLEVYGMRSLHDAWRLLSGEQMFAPEVYDKSVFENQHARYLDDLADVKGQHQVKRALEVAAAGSHNLLMSGPPGTGKSMIAKRLPTILPSMEEVEAIETTKVHSIAGLLKQGESLVLQRPFRSPHHTISDAGLLGGGSNPGPGEVSLAHNGVLFLDELPEFRRQTLEVMRQPLEDGMVTISRAAGSITFPSRYMMIAAMNPCPCGFYGDPKRECRCSPYQLENYRRKISGPLLDRIDIQVEVPLIEYKELASDERGEPSKDVRERVLKARSIQQVRYAEHADVMWNAHLPSRLMRQYCGVDEETSAYLEQVMSELNFSARAHDRILKLSRTLADLEAAEDIKLHHILEAVQFRTLDRKLMM